MSKHPPHPTCAHANGKPWCTHLDDYVVIPEYDYDGSVIGQQETCWCKLMHVTIPSPTSFYCANHETEMEGDA